ncbi:GTP pyrophosphokinase [Microbulbifer echini]|uniref:GTP pyrophosphokinase n=1 Tax=Microbulbifer echini TaxID=1529067 RepID=A0ABV4NQZ4_9GAMM
MSDLDTAIMIANKAHFGQKDKSGKPYILHPLRLALKMSSQEEQIVAVLHDVLEDSSTSVEDLKSYGFSRRVVDALACLTKQDGESYMDYIEKIKGNNLAAKIKMCDLQDNLDVTRLKLLGESDLRRVKKYYDAFSYLRASR